MLGDHLKKRRLELGLHQVDVAKILQVSEVTIVHWEKNQNDITIRYIPRIINFLGYLPFENILEQTTEKRILLLRQLRGITQEALAIELNTSPTKLYYWERGERHPPEPIVDLIDTFLATELHKHSV